MTTYINACNGPTDKSIQYSINATTADLRKGGSLSWRTNNPTLMPLNLSAKQNNALGCARCVAIFNNETDARNAFFAEMERPYYQRRTLAKAIKTFCPDYVIPPPQWDDQKNQPILPWIHQATGMDLDKPISNTAALYDFICSIHGWQVGTIEQIEIDEQHQAQHIDMVVGNNVLINGKTAVHAQSNGVLSTTDVCLTSVGQSVIPIPYTNVARSSDVTNVAQTVKVGGNGMANLKSYFSRSAGDEAGDKKGIHSRTIQGKAEFLTGSPNVYIEGLPAVRQDDIMSSNNANTTLSTLTQPGASMTAALRERLRQSETKSNPHQALTAMIVYAQPSETLYGAGKLMVTQHSFEHSYLLASGASEARDQLIEIPHIDTPCSLDLRLPCPNADEVMIPCGQVETQSLANDKTPEQKTALVAITPLVFTEASLDKSSACPPDDIENLPSKLKHATCGYIYIFVDGYLWREVACIGDGQYSDVDLEQEHSLDQRAHRSTATQRILIPTRTNGLFHAQPGLQNCKVEIAFSRLQWNWQYICDLGGMFVTDKRLNKRPLMQKCDDTSRALRLRGERCQTFDFSQHTDPANCDYIFASNGIYNVYLHDMVGIAQRYHVWLDELSARMQLLYEHNKGQPYYDSAMLACQMFLNSKYNTERNRYTTPYHMGGTTTPEKQSITKVVDKLSTEEIEKRLITPAEINLLEQYLEICNEAIDFINSQYQTELLNTLTTQAKVHPPTHWFAAFRDLSTTNCKVYLLSNLAVYTILNTLSKPLKNLPIFVQGLVTDESKPKRNQLLEQMRKLEQKIKQLNTTLTDKASWLRKQFCADINAFGDRLKNPTAAPINTDQEPGHFDPEKFKQSIHHFENSDADDIHVFALKSVTSGQQVYASFLSYWHRNLDLDTNFNVKRQIIEMVGATMKGTGLDAFVNLSFNQIGNLPEDHVIIAGNIGSHHALSHLNDENYRAANKELNKLSKAILNKQSLKKDDFIPLARFMAKSSHTQHSSHRHTIITNHKNRETVGVTTKSDVAALLQQHVDKLNSLEDIKRYKIEVLTVPINDLPKGLVHLYEKGNPLRDSRGLRINKLSLFNNALQKGVPVGLFAFSLFQITYAYQHYEDSFQRHGELYSGIKQITFWAELAAAGALMYEAYISSETAMSKNILKNRMKDINKLINPKTPLKITRLSLANGLVGIIGSAIMAWDAYFLLQKRDRDAATWGYTAAATSSILAYASIVSAAGPVVWGTNHCRSTIFID